MSQVRHIHNTRQFYEIVSKAEGLVVVDFTASWCGPCRRIAPLYDQLSLKYAAVVFLKVDVDELSDVASRQGVSAMPTFQFFKAGQKVSEFSGADPRKLEGAIQKLK